MNIFFPVHNFDTLIKFMVQSVLILLFFLWYILIHLIWPRYFVSLILLFLSRDWIHNFLIDSSKLSTDDFSLSLSDPWVNWETIFKSLRFPLSHSLTRPYMLFWNQFLLLLSLFEVQCILLLNLRLPLLFHLFDWFYSAIFSVILILFKNG